MSASPSKISKIKTVIGDTLQNVLTGLGISGLDKSTSSVFTEINLSFAELESAYASDWLAAKVVDLPPFDMTRAWRTMDNLEESDVAEKWQEEEKRLRVRQKFFEAMKWARLYGGSGIILNVDDGQEPYEPLNIDRIKQDSLSHLIVADQQSLTLGRINNDPLSANYGNPDTYRLAPSSLEIHHTRIITFEGIPLPLKLRRRNRYWGKSVIERLRTPLVNAASAQENIGALLHEATVDVIRIPELMELVANEEMAKKLQARFAVAKMQKSVNRMLLLDLNEEYEQHNQSFTGLIEIISKYLDIVGGAADIPLTRLLGQSPGGMNSTGESDIRNYYDSISSKQETEFREKLEYFDTIMYVNLFGKPPESDELSFEFNPLWQMDDMQKSELENSRANRDSAYLSAGVINEVIVARQLMDEGTYSGVDSEYVEELEKFMKQEENEPDDDDDDNDENDNDGMDGET